MAVNQPQQTPQNKPQQPDSQRPGKQPGQGAVDSPRNNPGKHDQKPGRPESTEIGSGKYEPSDRPGARGLERD